MIQTTFLTPPPLFFSCTIKLLKFARRPAHKWPLSLPSPASVAFSNADYSALCSIPLRLVRVYKLKLAFGFLFEVGAEQVSPSEIREITLYRADVFFLSSFLSVGRFCARRGRGGRAGEAQSPAARDGEDEDGAGNKNWKFMFILTFKIFNFFLHP